MIKITENEWESHYEPFRDLFDCDYLPVVTADERYVWTQCDADGNYDDADRVILASRRRVNRIACYLALTAIRVPDPEAGNVGATNCVGPRRAL